MLLLLIFLTNVSAKCAQIMHQCVRALRMRLRRKARLPRSLSLPHCVPRVWTRSCEIKTMNALSKIYGVRAWCRLLGTGYCLVISLVREVWRNDSCCIFLLPQCASYRMLSFSEPFRIKGWLLPNLLRSASLVRGEQNIVFLSSKSAAQDVG